MVRIEIELSAPRPNAMQGDELLDLANWITWAINENPRNGMAVHRITVEEGDM